jgi:hypothetical protein
MPIKWEKKQKQTPVKICRPSFSLAGHRAPDESPTLPSLYRTSPHHQLVLVGKNSFHTSLFQRTNENRGAGELFESGEVARMICQTSVETITQPVTLGYAEINSCYPWFFLDGETKAVSARNEV